MLHTATHSVILSTQCPQATRELADVSSLTHSLSISLRVRWLCNPVCSVFSCNCHYLGVMDLPIAHRYNSYYICTAMRASSSYNHSHLESYHYPSFRSAKPIIAGSRLAWMAQAPSNFTPNDRRFLPLGANRQSSALGAHSPRCPNHDGVTEYGVCYNKIKLDCHCGTLTGLRDSACPRNG